MPARARQTTPAAAPTPPPAPTAPGPQTALPLAAPQAAPEVIALPPPPPDKAAVLAAAVKAMLAALPRDLATLHWTPAAAAAFYAARAEVDKLIGG